MKDKKSSYSFCICICTYKRAELLFRLISDILNQSIQPEELVIIDGDPTSGQVFQIIKKLRESDDLKIEYIPSNHGNLSYQRYLGWKYTSQKKYDFIVYFDDDLRLMNLEILSNLLKPFSEKTIIGVTASTTSSGGKKFLNAPALMDREEYEENRFLRLFTNKYKPGILLSSGSRVNTRFDQNGIGHVEWLQGRVMTYRFSALTPSCFSDDLFALTHVHCGLGEDTFLSRQVMPYGNLIMINNLAIDHPDDALPNSYPIKSFNLAYATAYSRRFLNDHYRITEPPHFMDRIYLLKSYFGNNVLNVFRALTRPAKHRFAFAWGYFMGSVRGIFQKPTAKNLTPDIDWWKDAEEALKNVVQI